MNGLIENLYELESEKMTQMEMLERAFEKQLNELVSEMLADLPKERKDELKSRLIGILLPVKRELFILGFKSAVRLMAESTM